jgi:hypothetical protein
MKQVINTVEGREAPGQHAGISRRKALLSGGGILAAPNHGATVSSAPSWVSFTSNAIDSRQHYTAANSTAFD